MPQDYIQVITDEDSTGAYLLNREQPVVSIAEESFAALLSEERNEVLSSLGDSNQVSSVSETILVTPLEVVDNAEILTGVEYLSVEFVEEIYEVHLADAFVGTGGGEAGEAELPKISELIPDGQNAVVDSIPVEQLNGVKWLVTLTTAVNDKRVFEVSASWKGTEANYTVYGINGDAIGYSVSVDIAIASNNIELAISNTNGSALTADVVRISM